jgi:hypothetical protein
VGDSGWVIKKDIYYRVGDKEEHLFIKESERGGELE